MHRLKQLFINKRPVWLLVAGFVILFLFKNFFINIIITSFVHPGGGSFTVRKASLGWNKLVLEDVHLFNPVKEKVLDMEMAVIRWRSLFFRKPVLITLIKPKLLFSPKTQEDWNISFLLQHKDPFYFTEHLRVTLEDGEFVLEDKQWKGNKKSPIIQHIQNIKGEVAASSSSRCDIDLRGVVPEGGSIAIKGPLFAQPISGTIVVKGDKIPLSVWGNYFFTSDSQFKILDGRAELDIAFIVNTGKRKPSKISMDLTGSIKVKNGTLKVPLIRVPFDNIAGTMLVSTDTLRFKYLKGDIGFARAKLNGMFYQNFTKTDINLTLSDLTLEEMKYFTPFAKFIKNNITGEGKGELDIIGSLPNPRYAGNFAFNEIQFPDKTKGSGNFEFSFLDNKLIIHGFNLSSTAAQIAGDGMIAFVNNKPEDVAIQTEIRGDLKKLIYLSRLAASPVKLPLNLSGNIESSGTVFGNISNPVGELTLKWADNAKRDLSLDLNAVLGENNIFVKGSISPGNSSSVSVSGYANYKPDLNYRLAFHGEKVNISSLIERDSHGVGLDPGTLLGGVWGNKSEALFTATLTGNIGSNIKFLGGRSSKDKLFLFANSNDWPASFVFQGKDNKKQISVHSKLSGTGYFDPSRQLAAFRLNGGNIKLSKQNIIPLEKAGISTIGPLGQGNMIGTLISKQSVLALVGKKNNNAVLAANLPLNLIQAFLPVIKNKITKQLKGNISLAGRVDSMSKYPSYNGSVLVKGMKVGKTFFDLDGDFDLSLNKIKIKSASLIDSHGGATVSGSIPLNTRFPIALSGIFDRFPVSPILSLLGKEISFISTTPQGRFSGDISIHGTTQNPVVAGNSKIYHVALMGQPFEEIESQFQYGNRSFDFRKFAARYRDSIIYANGTYDLKNGIDISGTSPSLELADISILNKDLYPVLGRGSLSWNFKGGMLSPKGELDVKFKNLIFNGIPVASANGKILLTQDGFEMKSVTLQDKIGAVNISGKLLASLKKDNKFNFVDAVDINGDIDNVLLDTLLKWSQKKIPVTAAGKIKGHFALNGSVKAPNASMKVDLLDGSIENIPIETAHLDAIVEGEKVLIQKLFLSSDATRVNARGSFFQYGPKEATIDVQNLNMSVLKKVMPKIKDIYGDADLHLELNNKDKSVTGLAALEVRDGGIGKHSIDRLRALVAIQNGKALIQDLRISKEGHKVQVTGTIPFEFVNYNIVPKDNVDLKIRVERESLLFLPLIFPQILQANGFIAADINATGKITSPVLEGKAVLEQGNIIFKNMKTPLSNLSLELYFKPDGIHVLNGKADLGGGEVSISGGGSINRFHLDNLTANMLVKKAKIDSQIISGTVNSSLNLTKNNGDPELSGEVRIEQSTLGFPQTLPAHFAKVPLRLNVALMAGDRVSLRHPFVSLRINPGQLQLLGSLSNPYLSGELSTRQGNIYFLSNNFRITRGRAIFTEERGLVPYLETEATSSRRVESASISLNITGIPEQLRVELYSRPELPPKDIVSLLTGERDFQKIANGGDLNRYLGGEAMNLLTQAVKSQVLYGVEEAFASTFSLDLFALEFLPSGHFGLKVGKEFARNFYATYSRSFTSGNQTVLRDPQSLWGVEYQFNPYSSLWLTVDNVGEYNTGVRTRWNF